MSIIHLCIVAIKNQYNFVIATDSHYLTEKDFDIFKVILNTGDGEREVEDFYKYSHMMTWEEIKSYFNYLPEDFLESCRLNTIKVGESAEYYDLKEPSRIPRIPVPDVILLPNFDMSKYEYIQKFATSPHKQDRQYIKQIFDNFEKLIAPEKQLETMERINL